MEESLQDVEGSGNTGAVASLGEEDQEISGSATGSVVNDASARVPTLENNEDATDSGADISSGPPAGGNGQGNVNGATQTTETLQQGSRQSQQANIIQHMSEGIESETQQPTNQVEADERAKRRARRQQRRTIPAPNITTTTPPARHSLGSIPTQNLNANEPGGGLVLTPSTLATPTREAPEPAFKPARPTAPIQPPRIGAVHCTDRPEMQPGSTLMSTSNHSSGNQESSSHLSAANVNHSSGNQESSPNLSAANVNSAIRASVRDVVSAEVVPENQLDLERNIREHLFRSSSLRRDIIKDAPVAEIVPLGDSSLQFVADEATGEDQKTQLTTSRSLLIGGVFCLVALILILIITVIILATQGHFSDEHDNHEKLRENSVAASGLSYTRDFVLAAVPETIPFDRLPNMGYDGNLPQPLGSPATNLVAQSRLWNLPEADLAILNAGEIQGEIKQGNFTYGNLTADFMPFNNSLVIVTLNGKQIQSLLERVLQGIVSDLALGNPENALDGAYPYAAGLRYDVNLSQAFPHRVSSLEVNPQLSLNGNWTTLNLTAPYRIVTNTYLRQGGDGYHELSTASVEALQTGLDARDAFVEYCLHHKILRNPLISTFSTQSFHFVPGMYDNWNA